MKVAEVKELAAQRGIAAGRMNKGELIRTLQLSEGNEACFNTGRACECGQEGCSWREDCD